MRGAKARGTRRGAGRVGAGGGRRRWHLCPARRAGLAPPLPPPAAAALKGAAGGGAARGAPLPRARSPGAAGGAAPTCWRGGRRSGRRRGRRGRRSGRGARRLRSPGAVPKGRRRFGSGAAGAGPGSVTEGLRRLFVTRLTEARCPVRTGSFCRQERPGSGGGR